MRNVVISFPGLGCAPNPEVSCTRRASTGSHSLLHHLGVCASTLVNSSLLWALFLSTPKSSSSGLELLSFRQPGRDHPLQIADENAHQQGASEAFRSSDTKTSENYPHSNHHWSLNRRSLRLKKRSSTVGLSTQRSTWIKAFLTS